MRLSLVLFCALWLVGADASAQRSSVWSRLVGHSIASVGYVSKDWVHTAQGETHHLGFGQDPCRLLHGLQLGISYADTIMHSRFGWQFSTNVEYYTTTQRFVGEQGWDRFTEYDLHPQLLLTASFPCSARCSVIPFAGVGLNWAFLGYYSNPWYLRLLNGESLHDLDQLYSIEHYGRGVRPKRLNAQIESGCAIRFSNFIVRATYAYGMTDHHLVSGHPTLQHKLSLSLGMYLSEAGKERKRH